MDKQTINIATRDDFDVSYFCGSGAGGQARNKVASGVQIKHKESGAIGRASDSRSQFDNRCKAFERLTKTAQFKFWLARKLYELEHAETIEQSVEREMSSENIRFEVRGGNGWQEVPPEYFETEPAKVEA